MWNSVGRSGHHMQYVGNGYDEWEGLSPNGRQVKNQLTDEVRNLSGADYWHMRKAPVIEVKPAKKSKKQPSLRDSILLADRHLNRLEGLSERLENEYLLGEVGTNDYLLMRRSLDKRLQKAWIRVERENGWQEQDDSESLAQHEEPIENLHYTSYNESPILNTWQDELFHSLSDGNIFKIAYIKIKRIVEVMK